MRALGFDDRFLRMWRLYLAYCEAGFLERRVSDVQIVLARPGWRGDLAVAAMRASDPADDASRSTACGHSGLFKLAEPEARQ